MTDLAIWVLAALAGVAVGLAVALLLMRAAIRYAIGRGLNL